MTKYIVDIEANGLDPDRLWVMSVFPIEVDKLVQGYYNKDNITPRNITNPEEMKKFLSQDIKIIGHNFIGWDAPVLRKLLELESLPKITDTLDLSWTMEPRKNTHGLEAWGEHFGYEKVVVEDWNDPTAMPLYIERCSTDVVINTLLYQHLYRKMNGLYKGITSSITAYESYCNFIIRTISIAEINRWKVDCERLGEYMNILGKLKSEKFDKLFKVMPKVKKFAVKKMPKVLTKVQKGKKGEEDTLVPSAHALKWYEFLEEQGLPKDHTEDVKYVKEMVDPNPQAPQQVKQWLFDNGWNPRTFEYRKNTKGETKQVPQVTLKGKTDLCPSVLEIADKIPAIQEYAGYSCIKNRLETLVSIFDNLDENGTIPARAAGLTNTLRLKHSKPCVNLPKVSAEYGQYIRTVLGCREGTELLGSDLSSIENKCKEHFIYPYDPEYVKSLQTKGYDPHMELGLAAGMLSQEDFDFFKAVKTGELTDFDEKRYDKISNDRNKYKTSNYALQYGCGVGTLARQAGLSKSVAKKVKDAYWKINRSITEFSEDQKIKTGKNGEMWVLNPVNGFYYSLRTKKDIFSTICQGTATYVFNMWLSYVMKGLDKTVPEYKYLASFHDEFVLELPLGKRGEASKVVETAIQKVNNKLKFHVDISSDVQFGSHYSDIH